MKKLIIISCLMLIFSISSFAQSLSKFSDDEIARIKFSVHLITYDTANAFDNAKGEAYYKMIITAFSENLVIPNFVPTELTVNDKNKIEKFIQELKELKQNPFSWEILYEKETQYLIWLDKVSRRHTKYKLM